MVVAVELFGLFLGADERGCELLRLVVLVLEFGAVVFEVGDEGVELVGVDVAGARCNSCELFGVAGCR